VTGFVWPVVCSVVVPAVVDAAPDVPVVLVVPNAGVAFGRGAAPIALIPAGVRIPPASLSIGSEFLLTGGAADGCPLADEGTVWGWPAITVVLAAVGVTALEVPALAGPPVAEPPMAVAVAGFVVVAAPGFGGNLRTGAESLPTEVGVAAPELDFGPGVTTGALASVDGAR
jgi:hypothetical protein